MILVRPEAEPPHVHRFGWSWKLRRLGSDTMRKTVLIAVLTVGYLMIPFSIHADFYKWIDEKGTIHFTDDYSKVHPSYRDQIEIEKEIQEEKIALPTQEITPRSKEEEPRRDIYGRDEALWREKVRPWKKQLEEAAANFKNAHEKYMGKSEELCQRRYARWTRSWYKFKIIELNRLRIERAKYEAQIVEASEKLKKLEKEAEESKADPDWVK
jgi:hypothetical protein